MSDFWISNRGAGNVATYLTPQAINTIGPAKIGSLDDLRGEIERCDLPEQAVRLFVLLYVMVAMLKCWRSRVLDNLTLADVAAFEANLADRPLDAAIWKVFRDVTGAEDLVDAAAICVKLRDRGIAYKRRNTRRPRFADCGLLRFIKLTSEFERYAATLALAAAKKGGEVGPRVKRDDMIYLDPNGPRVYAAGEHKGEPFRIKCFGLISVLNYKKYKELVEQAEAQRMARPDHYLCQQLHYKAPQSQAAGPPDSLRRLACDANKELVKWFGAPPEGKKWIFRRRNAYVLSASVAWRNAPLPRGRLEVNFPKDIEQGPDPDESQESCNP